MEGFETADALPPGAALLGRYAVVRRIGLGGMGSVYEARDEWSGRRVALKVLRPSLAVHREVVERFLQEARAATSLPHPNIVQVLDVCEEPALGTWCIVQEFLDGMDLARWVERRGAIPPAEAVAIVTPVMSALLAVHAAGIVHRDVKPENVFLAEGDHGEMVPKLIDFGVSKVRDAARGQTQAGLAIGTPEYMSPEQARGDADVDARSDVWSMGVMLYQLLSGRTPFEAATPTLLLVAIITGQPVPIERVVPGLPPALVAIVDRALAHDRARRFQSMEEFLDALARCPLDEPQGGLDISAQTTSFSLPVASAVLPVAAPPLATVPSPALATVPSPAPSMDPGAAPPHHAPRFVPPPPPPRGSSSRLAVLALGAVIAVGAVIATAVTLRARATSPAPRPALVAAPYVAPADPAPMVPAEDAPAPAVPAEDAPAPPLAAPTAEDASVEASPAFPSRAPRRRRVVRPRNNAPILAP